MPVLFHTGSALGIHPSELSPPARYPARFRQEGPTYRFARRCSRRRSDGPAQRAAVPGLRPLRESLAGRRGLTHQPLDAPLGFALLGFTGESLAQGFARAPPTRFATAATRTGSPAPRSVARLPPGPVRSARRAGETDRTTLPGFLHQHDPECSSRGPPGL
jgi:hypothetical protein